MTRLVTDRLLLRPFEKSDTQAVRGYAGDPEWARYISEAVAADGFDEADARLFVERALPLEGNPTTHFAIELVGEMVGSIHLMGPPAEDMAELACLIRRSQWREGIALEAAQEVITYAFHQLGVVRIFARADARNEGSVRVMEKLGMRREGLLRAHRVDRTGVRCDEVIYGVLRDEWESHGTGAV